MLSSKRRPMAWVGSLTVAAGAVLLATPAAHAAVTVDSRSSVVDVFAAAASSFGGDPVTDTDTRTSTSTGFFSQRVDATADSFGVSAESEAGQTSNLTFTGGSFSGATVSADSSVFAAASSEEDIASADSTSEFSVFFTVPAGELYDYTLSGLITDDSARTSALVNLYDVTRDDDLLFLNTPGAYSDSGQLQPGQYELFGRTFGLVSADSPGGGDSSLTATFALTPGTIPEPASIAMIFAAATPLLRRGRAAAVSVSQA